LEAYYRPDQNITFLKIALWRQVNVIDKVQSGYYFYGRIFV